MLLKIGLIILSIVLMIGSSKTDTSIHPEKRFTSYPPQNLKLLSFGYSELIADSLWLRLVQDFDACDPNKPVPLNQTGCVKGWSFQMLDQVTTLAPQFRIPYIHGSAMLDIVTNDHQGAEVILERGLKQFPEDWSLAYRAAYHYLYESKNNTRAAELLTQAGRNGAPTWVFSLAGKLYSEEGKAFLAKTVLEDALQKYGDDPQYALKIQRRLDEVNSVINRHKD